MNLMDMLSSEAEPLYDSRSMGEILAQEADVEMSEPIVQPPDGVYHFPTILTSLQKHLMEYTVNVFAPELLKGVLAQRQKTKIHSLLEDPVVEADDMIEESDNSGLKSNELIEFLFEQLQITTNHPSLLVDHFLPKKLLLSEINERLINMSSKFQLFNRIIDSLIDEFNSGVKFDEAPIYNMLVVADSVKELELIEGLIIGKKLHYNNVSTVKLYGENYPVSNLTEEQPETKQSTPLQDSENEYKRKRKTIRPKPKQSPVLFLHLITISQLYNNYSPLLNSSLQFKMIFTFDMNLDSRCPSIEMLRSSQPLQIPIIIPIPLFSVDHLQMITPPPETDAMFSENNQLNNWKKSIINHFIINRINLFDDESKVSDFFVKHYGNDMSKLIQWFMGWETIKFPISTIFDEFNDKLLSYNEDKLIKRLEISYMGEKLPELDKFDYKSFKSKFTDLVYKRVNDLNDKIDKMRVEIDDFRVQETKRQLELDGDEELMAENYVKLRRLNEDANFVDKKVARVEQDLLKLNQEKAKLTDKLKLLGTFSKMKHADKVAEQEGIIKELQLDDDDITQEYNKLIEEHETLKKEYQDSSAEAMQLSVQIKTWQAKNDAIEKKANGPGIKVLPSLIVKDDLFNHISILKKLETENEFLQQFYDDKLERVIGERNTLIENSSGSTSRSINRISRGATPMQ